MVEVVRVARNEVGPSTGDLPRSPVPIRKRYQLAVQAHCAVETSGAAPAAGQSRAGARTAVAVLASATRGAVGSSRAVLAIRRLGIISPSPSVKTPPNRRAAGSLVLPVCRDPAIFASCQFFSLSWRQAG